MFVASLRNWKDYNEALVKRGWILLDLDFVADWSRELKAMNERKEGARYRYPESFIKLLAMVHAYVLPYRQLEGFTRALSHHVDGLEAPDYTTIWWRVAKMDVDLTSQVVADSDVTIAVDSSGIKVTNRGEWIRRKWKVKRAFIKAHIAVNTETKQIIAMEITKENVSDGRMLEPLVKDSASKTSVKRVLGDGAYDSRKNFHFLADHGIEPVIKVRKNSSFKARGCMPRKKAVVEQLGNPEWKKKKGYGYRWIAESSFSAIKRIFGEHISSIKWGNIVKELLLKASIYNLFMAMNP
jgi:hypothetical protein